MNPKKDSIVTTAVERLKQRILTTEEIETIMEQMLDYLIQYEHMNVTGLGFTRAGEKCDIEIIYGN